MVSGVEVSVGPLDRLKKKVEGLSGHPGED